MTTHAGPRGAGRVAAALVLVLSASAFTQDGPEGPAFVELVSERATYYAGEPFTVTIRVGIDAQFLEERAVQPFRRELQVPVQIHAPWFDEPEGVRRLPIYGVRAGSGRKLALNDDVTAAHPRDVEDIDGRTFRIFDVDRRLVAEAPGALEIPAPRVHLAYATRFEESFVEGRVPVDRHDTTVDGTGLVLTILALPEDGRPAAFDGAVGRWAPAARVDRTECDVGDTLRLILRISGDGNEATVTPPSLDRLEGFHVLGVLPGREERDLTFTYDLVPQRADITEIPSIAIAAFDPGPPALYRVERTAAIPLTVRGDTVAPDLQAPPERAAEPVPAPSLLSPSTITTLVIAAVVLVLCHFLAFWFLLSRRARAAKARLGRADARVARDVADGADPADALAAFVAARLGCDPAAVISPDLPNRLTAAGVPGPLAERTSKTLERLIAARYGGAAEDDAAAVVGTLVAELDPLLRSGA